MRLYLHLRDPKKLRQILRDFPEAKEVLDEFVVDGTVTIEMYTNSHRVRLMTAEEVRRDKEAHPSRARGRKKAKV